MRALSIIGTLPLLLGSAVIGANWAAAAVSWRNQRRGIDRHISTVPLVGPLLAAIGLALIGCGAWSAVPWIVDIATLQIVMALPLVWQEICATSRRDRNDAPK